MWRASSHLRCADHAAILDRPRRAAPSQPEAEGRSPRPSRHANERRQNMPISKGAPTRAQASLLQWIAAVGAVTAPALATLQTTTVGSARARLTAAGRAGLVTGERPLAGEE